MIVTAVIGTTLPEAYPIRQYDPRQPQEQH